VLAFADVDNDGAEDLIAGAPRHDEQSTSDGAAWIIYGPITTDSTNPESTFDVSVFCGRAGWAYAGSRLTVGDFDADGLDEVAIGAPSYSSTTTCQVGGIEDENSGLEDELADRAHFLIEDTGKCGSDLDAGDQNNDGYDDLAVGAAGDNAVYVFNGPLTGDLDLGDADANLSGPTTLFVTLGGDVNSDGNDDLIAGTYDYNNDTGRVYFFTGPLSGTQSLSSAAGTWTGPSTGDYATSDDGHGLSYAGDVTGDGYDDVLVGGWGDDTKATDAGAAWLMFGGPNY